jgi:hypothetical protein
MKAGQHLAVAGDGGGVEDTLLRFNAAPLHREPVSVVPQLGHQIKVALGIAPPIAGQAAAIAVPNGTGALFKVPPIVIAVVALHLVGGSRGSP